MKRTRSARTKQVNEWLCDLKANSSKPNWLEGSSRLRAIIERDLGSACSSANPAPNFDLPIASAREAANAMGVQSDETVMFKSKSKCKKVKAQRRR